MKNQGSYMLQPWIMYRRSPQLTLNPHGWFDRQDQPSLENNKHLLLYNSSLWRCSMGYLPLWKSSNPFPNNQGHSQIHNFQTGHAPSSRLPPIKIQNPSIPRQSLMPL